RRECRFARAGAIVGRNNNNEESPVTRTATARGEPATMKRVASYVVGTLATIVCGVAAEAHHSYAAFDRCAPYTIEGEIDAVEWVNPHILMSVKTADTT